MTEPHYRIEYNPGLGCEFYAVDATGTRSRLRDVGQWTPIQCLNYARESGFNRVKKITADGQRIDLIFRHND